MTDITLPTETQVRAVDTDTFTWDDLMDGLITESQGAVYKLVSESLSSGAVINISEAHAGTGKSAKFLLDNVTGASNFKIITTDNFSDAYLTTSEYFDNVGNAANVYKFDASSRVRVNSDEGGNAVSVDTLDIFGADPSVILSTTVLADAPTAMGVNDLASYQLHIPNSVVVDHAGGALAATGNITIDLAVINPWPVSMGYAAHEVKSLKQTIASMFNNLNTGGGMIITNFHLPKVQTAFWETFNAMTNTGRLWTAEYVLNSESDGTGYWQAAVVKKS
jgi:hypothetical protein